MGNIPETKIQTFKLVFLFQPNKWLAGVSSFITSPCFFFFIWFLFSYKTNDNPPYYYAARRNRMRTLFLWLLLQLLCLLIHDGVQATRSISISTQSELQMQRI